MQVREQVEQVIEKALQSAVDSGGLVLNEVPSAGLERPRDESNGDWASTVAMRCAKQAKRNPREIANTIVEYIDKGSIIESVEIAGPGFINVRLTPACYQQVLADVLEQRENYGKGHIEEGKRYVNLEYISANPTGPMHVGHGRWAALGDATARVMRHAGYDVYEEFYINDAGVQMNLFGRSVLCRYKQLLGEDIEMIENGYGGGYVKDIAQEIIDRDGNKWLELEEGECVEAFREMAYAEMLKLMQDTLEGFGTTFDCWFSERSLYEPDEQGNTAVSRALAAMDEKGYVYEKDGATWFRSTAFDDEKDRVLIKENGENTYFMSDVAYHYDKIMRGFDHLINIWGADHHGYVKRCEAMLAAWGYPGRLEIMLGQLVNLFRDGEAVRMSKRTGEMITFAELLEEVGVDATRYLMLAKSQDQAIDFDIEAAKKKDASNPVYYVQYAHARICSILRKAAAPEAAEAVMAGTMTTDELVASLGLEGASLEPLTHESDNALMRKMSELGELVCDAARDRAAYRLTHYAEDLAAAFHRFYTNCHVLVDDKELEQARLQLVNGTRIVLALSLNLLGVSAPASM